jgi:glyceraldehyde-3-phosphate dehydrogenase/erythrose-4-phosphate dehydrogenase
VSTRIAINGLGRIGRAILKLVIDEPAFELVAIDDLADVENLRKRRKAFPPIAEVLQNGAVRAR